MEELHDDLAEASVILSSAGGWKERKKEKQREREAESEEEKGYAGPFVGVIATYKCTGTGA